MKEIFNLNPRRRDSEDLHLENIPNRIVEREKARQCGLGLPGSGRRVPCGQCNYTLVLRISWLANRLSASLEGL
jgi:hypothetical protein